MVGLLKIFFNLAASNSIGETNDKVKKKSKNAYI